MPLIGFHDSEFLGYSLTVSKDEIVAIHEAAVLTNIKKAAKVIVNLACLCLLVG